MGSLKKYLRIGLNIVIPLLWAAFICLVLPGVLRYFLPFVIGWIIALIANPLVKFLERKLKIVRRHSSAVIVILVLALVIGAGYFLVSWLVTQVNGLVGELPAIYELVVAELEEILGRFDRLAVLFPDNMQAGGQKLIGSLGQSLNVLVEKVASPTVEAAGSVARSIPSVLVSVIVTILSSYFFIADQDRIMERIRRYLPERTGRYLGRLRGDIWHLVGGYFLAQFKIMFVVALILMAGFLILGIRYGILLAIGIAMLDFLPLFGTGTVLIPWAVFQLLRGEYALAAGLGLLYVLSQVIRQIVQPKLVGDTMGLNPMATLFLLYLGFKVQGISGMIIAVPLGILVMKLFEYGAFDLFLESVRELVKEIERIRDGE